MKKTSISNRIFAVILALCLMTSGFLLRSVNSSAGNTLNNIPEIPEYSGEASVQLNKNVPVFSK